MQIVPVQATPNQTFTVLVANQNCRINLYTKSAYGLFMDILVPALSTFPQLGIICRDRNRIIRYPYLGFIGDFEFFDLQGTSDPVYTGLGTRFQLAYVEATDPELTK